MGRAGITLKLEGFDEMLKDIEKAGQTMDSAVKTCMEKSAQIMDTELRSSLSSATESGLANRMPSPKIEKVGNSVTAYVGFEKGEYNPKNPSDGYKAVFLNYGTPHRSIHGHEKARGFIQSARRKAKPKIKKQQQETLEEILSRLKK